MQHSESKQMSCPVLGIALVVEQLGKGADLIFRYPTNAMNSTSKPNQLFYSISPRIMAKLFRTKAPLCNQPMTLLVGETIFCCRSILLAANSGATTHDTEETNHMSSDYNSNSSLVLFSIIVGLLADPFSASNRLQGPKDPLSSSQSLTNVTNPAVRHIHTSLYRLARVLEREERRCLYVSRQVQRMINIRLWTLQSWNGQEQRNVIASESSVYANNSGKSIPTTGPKIDSPETKWTDDDAVSLDVSSHSGTAVTTTSFYSKDDIISVQDNYATPVVSTRSSSNLSRIEDPTAASSVYDIESAPSREEDLKTVDMINQEQAIIENMLSEIVPSQEDPPIVVEDNPAHSIPIFGNLARELVQTFYALSRYDTDFGSSSLSSEMICRSTPDSSISSILNNSIVYINNHIAIPMEPASSSNIHNSITDSNPDHSASLPFVRSYHTLIFADLSPHDLLCKLQSDVYANNNPTIKLLQIVGDPFQSLADVANQTAMSLPTVLDAALLLVRSGVCVLAPTFHRSDTAFVVQGNNQPIRLSYNIPNTLQDQDDTLGGVRRMKSMSLAFSQRFGPNLPIFCVISVLTTPLLNTHIFEGTHSDNTSGFDSPNFIKKTKEMEDKYKPITLGDVLKISTALHAKLSLRNKIPSSLHLFTQRIQETLQMDHLPPGFYKIKMKKHHFDRSSDWITTNDIEEAIVSMASWLYSNKIITCLKEYLVPISTGSKNSINKVMINERTDEKEKQLYEQVMESNYLSSGTISNAALAWRCGWTTSTLRTFQQYVLNNTKCQLVLRSHSDGDDWGSP